MTLGLAIRRVEGQGRFYDKTEFRRAPTPGWRGRFRSVATKPRLGRAAPPVWRVAPECQPPARANASSAWARRRRGRWRPTARARPTCVRARPSGRPRRRPRRVSTPRAGRRGLPAPPAIAPRARCRSEPTRRAHRPRARASARRRTARAVPPLRRRARLQAARKPASRRSRAAIQSARVAPFASAARLASSASPASTAWRASASRASAARRASSASSSIRACSAMLAIVGQSQPRQVVDPAAAGSSPAASSARAPASASQVRLFAPQAIGVGDRFGQGGEASIQPIRINRVGGGRATQASELGRARSRSAMAASCFSSARRRASIRLRASAIAGSVGWAASKAA